MSALPLDRALRVFIEEESERARLREKIFGPLVRNHSVWRLLLALWCAQQSGTELTIKGAAYSAAMPLSSALRKVNEICAAGLVKRRSDPDDGRQFFVSLTSQGQDYFMRLFAEWTATKASLHPIRESGTRPTGNGAETPSPFDSPASESVGRGLDPDDEPERCLNPVDTGRGFCICGRVMHAPEDAP